MQHEEPYLANLTILRREEEPSTVTFDYVKIVLIILFLLITIAKRVFFKNNNNTEVVDATNEKTSSTLSILETSQ